MKYCSVCSGVEAASLAWEMLGWEPVFFAEVEPFPSAVLMQKFGATKPLNPLDPELAGSKKEKKQRENWKKQIEKFSQGGTIPNLGDLTKIKGDNYRGAVDILIGGTPCQGFSVAGQRKGLDDERSCMAIKFLELVDTIRPGWVVWENVPGVISSWSGEPEDETITEWEERNDLDQFFAGFRQCGYNIAWRVLDTQYVRVEPGFSGAIPQRRRRVFAVGYLGSWQYPAAVLFDAGCMSWNPPPRRKERKGTSRSVARSPRAQSQLSHREDADTLICMATGQGNAEVCEDKAPTLNCNHEAPIIINNRPNDFNIENNMCHTLRATDYKTPPVVCYENHGNDSRITEMDNISPSLTSRCETGGNNLPLIQYAIPIDLRNAVRDPDKHDAINRQGCGIGNPGDPANTLSKGNCHGVAANNIVRRLTPLECERLMGFPDNHTLIEWNGKPKEKCPDGPRYKACGNSFSVNVIRWIGKRIQMVKEIENASKN